jgi:hypothetical protein
MRLLLFLMLTLEKPSILAIAFALEFLKRNEAQGG